MIKLVNKAVVVENEVKFNVGDVAQYTTEFFNGRGYNVNTYVGTIVKVNKVTVDIELKNGNVYRVNKKEVTVLYEKQQ